MADGAGGDRHWIERNQGAVVIGLLGLQGALGGVQWALELPAGLVWLHITLAVGNWLAMLWTVAVAGRAGYYVRYFGGSWGNTIQAGFVFAAVLLLGWLFSSGTLRSRLRVFINKNFFSYRYDYREEWLRLMQTLVDAASGASLPDRSVQALADIVEAEHGRRDVRGEAP